VPQKRREQQFLETDRGYIPRLASVNA